MLACVKVCIMMNQFCPPPNCLHSCKGSFLQKVPLRFEDYE